MRVYSDPSRETETYSLPDVEVFYSDDLLGEDGENLPAGWYWWTCFPGCLPDSDPFGPYETAEEAVEAAQNLD